VQRCASVQVLVAVAVAVCSCIACAVHCCAPPCKDMLRLSQVYDPSQHQTILFAFSCVTPLYLPQHDAAFLVPGLVCIECYRSKVIRSSLHRMASFQDYAFFLLRGCYDVNGCGLCVPYLQLCVSRLCFNPRIGSWVVCCCALYRPCKARVHVVVSKKSSLHAVPSGINLPHRT
jgi:hypothetical protein